MAEQKVKSSHKSSKKVDSENLLKTVLTGTLIQSLDKQKEELQEGIKQKTY